MHFKKSGPPHNCGTSQTFSGTERFRASACATSAGRKPFLIALGKRFYLYKFHFLRINTQDKVVGLWKNRPNLACEEARNPWEFLPNDLVEASKRYSSSAGSAGVLAGPRAQRMRFPQESILWQSEKRHIF